MCDRDGVPGVPGALDVGESDTFIRSTDWRSC